MKSIRYFFLICILMIFQGCKETSSGPSDIQLNEIVLKDLMISEEINVSIIEHPESKNKNITYLRLCKKIELNSSDNRDNYFVNITDLCIDRNDNLYVADSTLHKVFKFDNKQEFILSFGDSGQGLGEFIGILGINSGNDGKIYISDNRGLKICIFSPEGNFIREIHLESNPFDIPVVNSRGEIYLLSGSGFEIIDIYGSDFNFLQSFLNIKFNHYFPLEKPSKPILKRILLYPPSFRSVLKVMAPNNHYYIILNNSLLVFHYNDRNILELLFKAYNPRISEDLIKRYNTVKKKGGWINCFGAAFLDNKNLLNLVYFNKAINEPEIYRFRSTGQFVDTLKILNPEYKSNRIVEACDSKGNYFGINNEKSIIYIYRTY